MRKKSKEAFMLDLLKDLLNVSSNNEIDIIVDTFLEKICHYFNFDCAEIYLPTGEYLILRGVYGIDRYYVCKVEYKVNFELSEKTLKENKIYIGKNIHFIKEPIFKEYKSQLIMPILSYPIPIGILVIRTKDNRVKYLTNAIKSIEYIIMHFSLNIKNILQRSIYERKDRQTENLSRLYLRLNEIDSFNGVLDSLSEDIAKIFDAKKAIIKIRTLDNQWIEGKTSSVDHNFDLRHIEKNNKLKKYHKEGINLISNIRSHEDLRELFPIIDRSVMFDIIKINNKISGYVIIIDRKLSASNPLGDFTLNDKNIFNTILINIAKRISEHNNTELLSEASKKNQSQVFMLNKLYDVSNILLDKSKEDDILYVLLTMTTIGDVFAFNRAFAFLYDKEFNVFRGKMSVAPDNAFDAGIIWEEMKNKNTYGLREKLFVLMSEHTMENSSYLNDNIISMTIPNSEKCSLFHEVYNTHNSINITDITNDEKIEELKQYTNDIIGHKPFAIIPIINAFECTGIIVVDNRFNNAPIPDDDLNYLKMFSRQASISIEYSALYNKIEKADRDLKEANKNLVDSRNLALIGEMTSSIAHNLRNFMVPIAGFANRLIKYSTDEKSITYAKIIAKEVEQLEIYVKKNLSLSKSFNLEIESISINELLASLTLLTNEYIKKQNKGIKFFESNTLGEIELYWDYSRIHEALFDLIINAIDAIQDYDLAFISIIIKANKFRDNIIDIVVENTNSYIDPSIIDKIFTPFFSTKSHGIGIGLATCKRIIEGHGGSIAVESKKSNSEITTFFISLPMLVE